MAVVGEDHHPPAVPVDQPAAAYAARQQRQLRGPAGPVGRVQHVAQSVGLELQEPPARAIVQGDDARVTPVGDHVELHPRKVLPEARRRDPLGVAEHLAVQHAAVGAEDIEPLVPAGQGDLHAGSRGVEGPHGDLIGVVAPGQLPADLAVGADAAVAD